MTDSRQELLREFRSAHRLINECQTAIFEVIFKKVMPTFGLLPGKLECRRLFCSPLRAIKSPDKALSGSCFGFSPDNWAWDLIYTHVLEFYLGSVKGKSFSVIQVSDTGSYQTTVESYKKKDSSAFPPADECESLLIFKMKPAGNAMHTSEATIRELIHMPENIYHSKSGSVYARYDMLDFMDERGGEAGYGLKAGGGKSPCANRKINLSRTKNRLAEIENRSCQARIQGQMSSFQ